jgi:pilus assembly protein Flp/PilA
MNTMIRNFLSEEDGVTAIEYGILAAVVAAALISIFGGTNGPLQQIWNSIITQITTAVGKL